jgi:hypothetical protein
MRYDDTIRLVADIWLRRRHHNMRLTVVVCLPAHSDKPAYCWRAFRGSTEDASGTRKYRFSAHSTCDCSESASLCKRNGAHNRHQRAVVYATMRQSVLPSQRRRGSSGHVLLVYCELIEFGFRASLWRKNATEARATASQNDITMHRNSNRSCSPASDKRIVSTAKAVWVLMHEPPA